jgi:hypothetical protein
VEIHDNGEVSDLAKRRKNTKVVSKSSTIREILKGRPTATAKEIQAELKVRGVKASDALVNKIKYGRNGTAGEKKSGPRGGSSTSKADAIRAAWGELGMNARPRDVISALAKRGVAVSSAQVSTLRKSMPRRRNAGGVHASSASFDHLLAAKHLAERMGGIEAAQAALANLARLVEG